MSSDPNTNPGIDPNANTGVNDPKETIGAAPASTTSSMMPSMKMPSIKVPKLSTDKQSIGEILNKESVIGMDLSADLDGLTDDWIDKIMQINFRGSFASIRALRPVLLKAENPVVVNISSIAGRTAVGSNVAYCASKAAVDSMTMSLGRALAPEIRVVSLAPGWVNGEYAKHLPKEYIKEQENKTPLGRIAEPEDIGKALIAIAESFTFSTGCIFPVDGGRPLN